MPENKKSSFGSKYERDKMPSRRRYPSNNEEDFVLDSIGKNGMALKDATQKMKSNKKIVLDAVKQDGRALQFANEDMKRDKDVVMAAVKQHRWGLQYAHDNMKGDKAIVLAAVQQNGRALQFANEDMKGDKDIVMAAVKQFGLALGFANEEMKRNKEIVLAAVKQEGWALQFSNEDMKGDKDIVLAAVKQFGTALQFASDDLRADKEVVCSAVQNNPDALKFAKDGLNQADESWIAAGLWNQKHPAASVEPSSTIEQQQQLKLFVLSTRYSLREDSESSVTHFTKLLNESTFVQKQNIMVYSPNKFSKCSCDEKWTRMDWPCRGTDKSCQINNKLEEGKPHDDCCWRFSFRWHLEEAKKTKGVMIQVVDCIKTESFGIDHVLGDGQKIENVMAKDVGTKIFRVYQPSHMDHDGRIFSPAYFGVSDIDTLLTKIERWYDDGCKDMTDYEISFEHKLKP